MDADRVNIYTACDRAIKTMNRDNLREFGKLKAADWDKLHVIRDVKRLYKKQAQKAEGLYYEVATEAYILGLVFCGISNAKAHQMAKEAITEEWVRDVLEDSDPVTLYAFDSEVERKAERLVEAIAAIATSGTVAGGVTVAEQIDKALRDWVRQLGQYAINMTDYAEMQSYQDGEVAKAMWLTARDERVCRVCKQRDGKLYPLDEFPIKPHYGCRCRKSPVMD